MSSIRTLLLAAAIVISLTGVTAGAAKPPPNFSVDPFGAGRPAPKLIGVDQFGRRVSTADLRGKWVLLNFVAGWSRASRQMAAEAQKVADQLRNYGEPFVYITIVLQDEEGRNATKYTALDWAALYGITDPVIGPAGLTEADSNVWQQFFGYSYHPASSSPSVDAGPTYLSLPLTVVINPQQKIVRNHAGLLPPVEIFKSAGRPDISYGLPSVLSEFKLTAFSFTANVGTPPSVESASRSEPTTDLTFPITPPILEDTLETPEVTYASFTCDSSERTDTPFRVTRKFRFPDLDGNPETELGFKTNSYIWGQSGSGVLDQGSVFVELKYPAGKTLRFTVPMVSASQWEANVGPFKPSELGAPDDLNFEELTLTLQWIRQPNSLLVLQSIEDQLQTLPLADKARAKLGKLLQAARLAASPGSKPGRAVALLQQFEAEIARLGGSQVDLNRATHLAGLAASARAQLTDQPPRTERPLFRAVAANPREKHAPSLFRPGKIAPDFTGMSQRGPFRLKSTRGKWVLLDFSGVWCAPCNLMAKEARSVADSIQGAGVPFEYVTILLDSASHHPAKPVDGLDWASKYNIDMPVITPSGLPASQDLLRRHAQYYTLAGEGDSAGLGLPVVVLINPEGRIVQVHRGFLGPQGIFDLLDRSDIEFVETVRETVGLNSYSVEFDAGSQSAIFDPETMANTSTELPPDRGSLTDLTLTRDSLSSPSRAEENLFFSFGTPSFAASDSVRISLTNLDWNGQPGIALPYFGGVFAGEFGPFVGGASLQTPEVGLGFSFPDFYYLGVDPGAGPLPSLLGFKFYWLRRDAEVVISFMQRRLPDVGLTEAQTNSLTVLLHGALASIHKDSPAKALKQITRFKAKLQALKAGAEDPALAEAFLTAANELLLLIPER